MQPGGQPDMSALLAQAQQMQQQLMAQMPPELGQEGGQKQPPSGSMAPTEDPGPAPMPGAPA